MEVTVKKPVTLSLRETITNSAKLEAKRMHMSLSEYVTEALVKMWSEEKTSRESSQV
jgi:hypothetical protein